jgi:hypothetical protein
MSCGGLLTHIVGWIYILRILEVSWNHYVEAETSMRSSGRGPRKKSWMLIGPSTKDICGELEARPPEKRRSRYLIGGLSRRCKK